MKRTVWRLGLSFFAGVCLTAGGVLLLLRTHADAQPPARQAPTPPAANSVNSLSATTTPVDLTRYVSKYTIENPTEKLLAARTQPAAAPATPFVNPRVEPGKVRWHKTLAEACAAARKSGKPVLLFQMMGRLDERFC